MPIRLKTAGLENCRLSANTLGEGDDDDDDEVTR